MHEYNIRLQKLTKFGSLKILVKSTFTLQCFDQIRDWEDGQPETGARLYSFHCQQL